MKLQRILVISMGLIVAIIFVGLFFIYLAVSSVKDTAQKQTVQISN